MAARSQSSFKNSLQEGLVAPAAPSKPGFVARFCQFVCDLVLLIVFILVLPVLLCILIVVCFIPMLDRLLHWRREYLDGVSAAQIHNCPEAVIHGIMISTERVSSAQLFKNFDAAYLSSGRPEYARWKQRIVRRKCLWPYYQDASAEFSPAHHMRSYPEPITKDELERSLGKIEVEPLDFDRPPWELRFYENFTDENGKACSASMLRMHHSFADGFTGMRVLLQESRPNKPPADTQSAARADRSRPRISCLQIVRFYLASLKKLLLMQPDPTSLYKASTRIGPPDPKTTAWNSLRHTSVEELKQVGKALGGVTINDILISALTGALGKYVQLQTNAESAVPNEVTTCIWVSLSPLKDMYKSFDELPLRWGNATLGACYIPLAVGPAHWPRGPRDILEDVRRNTSNPALMVEAGVATSLLSFMGWLPPVIAWPVWIATTNKISVSMSNVPGPQYPMEWAGLPIRSMFFFVPPTGTLSIFVTIASFNGGVTVGMGADAAVLSTEALRQITGELFENEIRQLQAAVPGAGV